jgi:hypothetical protein
MIRFSDDQRYIVKFKGNPRGNRVLVNEYVCNKLVQALELSGLEGQVLTVDAFFISNEPQLKSRNLNSGLQYGPES